MALRIAKFFCVFLFTFFIVSVESWPQQSIESRSLILTGATIIDGTGSGPLRDAVIIIDDGKVKAIGKKGLSYPPDSTVVDLAGKYIIPGLVESHVHYEAWMGELYLNFGVTTVFALGAPGSPPGHLDKAMAVSNQPDARGPRIFSVGEDLEASPSMTEEEVRQSVREWLKQKPAFANLPTFNERTSKVWQWAADEVHKAGLMTFGHTENAPESIQAGHDVVEHLWGFVQAQMSPKELDDFQKGRHLHWGLFFKDWVKLDQMIKDAVARGVYINPTFFFELGSLSEFAGRHEVEAYRLYSDPLLMAYFPLNIAESLLQKHRQIRNFSSKYENLVLLSRLTSDQAQEFKQGYRLAGEFLKRFVAAGGKIQAGTDAPSGGTPGLSLHQEMELLVEAGLTPMQALQSATLWSAEMLSGKGGVLGRPTLGLIAEGAVADLVVLTANPLDDIANTKKIERVMKGGMFVKQGYTPTYYTFTRPARRIAMATPVPAISAISPHTVTEGSETFEMVVEGVGFVSNSLVRVDGVSMPTTFVNPRTLKVRIPGTLVQRATPDPLSAPGPAQMAGVFGDRMIPITVYNSPPEGGISNSILLRVRAKWLAAEGAGR